jgi:hypothetical protein
MRSGNVVLAVVVAVLIAACFAFRPDELFLNTTVREGLPAAFASGSQTLETGTFHTVLHPTGGFASVYRSAVGSRILRLTDFKTTNGPDVHIFMVATDDAADNDSVKESDSIDLGRMKGNVGDQNYSLDPDVDLSKYRSVVVWCKRFSFNFGYAPLMTDRASKN